MMMTQKTLFPAAAAAMLLLFLPFQTMAFDYCCKKSSCLSTEFNTDQCTSFAALESIAKAIKNNFADEDACKNFELNIPNAPKLKGLVCGGNCCLIEEDSDDTCGVGNPTCIQIGTPAPTPESVCEDLFQQTACFAPSFNYCCKKECTMDQKNKPDQCYPLSAVDRIAAGMTGNFATKDDCENAVVNFLPDGSTLQECGGSCCAVDGQSCDDAVLNGGASCLTLGERVTPAEAYDYIGLKQCTFCDEGAGCNMDPHFVTWPNTKKGGDRTKFDFHGQCDMIFAKAPKFAENLGMNIQIRTTKRYKYSYIESAALQIGQDVFQLDSFGTYAFNGVSNADVDQVVMADKYPVVYSRPSEHQHLFDIQLSTDEHIKLSTYKDMVNVKFENASSYFFHNSLGMMGHFETGEMRARDGKTIISDPDAFGQEWQVLESEPSLFQVADRFPQYPVGCEMPDTTTVTRRLGSTIAEKAAEEACAHWGDAKETCVYDVMATGDIDLASAVVF